MKIALAQINPTVGDFQGNTGKILEFAGRAAGLGVDLVMFPELAVCGYPPADLLEKRAFVDRAMQAVGEVRAWTETAGRPAILVGTVMPAEADDGKIVKNCAVLLEIGEMKAVQQKMLLPFYDVFDEQRYFEPAAGQKLATVKTAGGEVPVAVTICEDAWNDKGFWPRRMYAVDPVERLMESWDSQGDGLQRQAAGDFEHLGVPVLAG